MTTFTAEQFYHSTKIAELLEKRAEMYLQLMNVRNDSFTVTLECHGWYHPEENPHYPTLEEFSVTINTQYTHCSGCGTDHDSFTVSLVDLLADDLPKRVEAYKAAQQAEQAKKEQERRDIEEKNAKIQRQAQFEKLKQEFGN